MSLFSKGAIFTMGGKEYEVIEEGNEDPASCLLYVPLHEKETADPLTIRMWKAEAKLARGDIMLRGVDKAQKTTIFYPPLADPLEQIAELKKRIHAIEQRRLTLLKVNDPTGQILVQDNIVRPNRPFDIWNFTGTEPGRANPAIQYIKMRALILTISTAQNIYEHFLFNIADQLQPCCKITGDTLASEGLIHLDLSPELKTIQGTRTGILKEDMPGRIEITVDARLNCKFASGITVIYANIQKCSHIREVNAPSFRIGQLTFPEIGEHTIAILGICLDIYTVGKDNMPLNAVNPIF